MPDQLFYNTGIFTYIWILTNRKPRERKGKVQLINAVAFYQKMGHSLGNKRNEIGDGEDGSPDQIAAITNFYGNFQHDETAFTPDGEEVIVGKIFDNDDFGYWRITVERPLRLNFQASPARIERLQDERAFINLAKSRKKGAASKAEIAAGKETQQAILETLKTLDGERLYQDRAAFDLDLVAAFKDSEASLTAALKKAILNALSERDENAEICTDRKGDPEPDPQLRDHENVPLKEDIQEYFEREVLPHVPDAWIDESRTVKGYEISFTRYFYEYNPLRPLEEIRAEILALEEALDGELAEALTA